MAGAFGYGRDTWEVAVQLAEADLLPAVRAAQPDTVIVADGTSSRHQVELGAGREALHVARVLDRALSACSVRHRVWLPRPGLLQAIGAHDDVIVILPE